MPKKLTSLKPARVVNALIRLGWNQRKAGSGHIVMKKDGNSALISIPNHKGKDVKPGLLATQLKGAGISVQDFLEAVR